MDTRNHAQNPPLSTGLFTQHQLVARGLAQDYAADDGEPAYCGLTRTRRSKCGCYVVMDEMEPASAGWIDNGTGAGYLWGRRTR